MTVTQLDHLNVTVENVAESVKWYGRVFGFERVEGGVRQGHPWAIIRAGEAMLCLYERPHWSPVSDALKASTPVHRVNHVGLRITDEARWLATLEREAIEPKFGGPIRYGASTSWYIDDPTGHEIEVVCWDDDVIRFPHAA